MANRTRRLLARPPRLVRLCLLSLYIVAVQSLLFPFAPAFGSPLDRARPSPPAVAGETGPSLPFTEVNPYGANTFLSKEVEDWKREKTVQLMAEGGLGWMKQQFPWSEIEPTTPGRFWDDKYNQNSWDKYDRIVELAEKHGVRVIARLDNTPQWARPPGTNQHTPPTDPERYVDFVAAFVEHYRGRVQFLQIWNEPNLKGEWGGRLDPAGYVDLLRRTRARVKQIDPNVMILSAPLAQTLEGGDRGLNELLFLQQLYDAGLRGNYDILMANGYGFDQPPDAAPGATVLNLRRVELVREIMVRNGDEGKPIWLNEYGWNAAPASLSPDRVPWQRVTPAQQATYTVEGIRYAREHWPWLGVVNIWYFRQVGDIPADMGEYYFRMVELEFTPTPLYREVQRATSEQRLAPAGRYGPLSPALVERGRWRTMSIERTGALALRSERANDRLIVRFRGNQLTIVGERGPRGGRLGVEIDESTEAVSRLPRDEQGRRYVDFRADGTGETVVQLISGLDPFRPVQEHVAVLTVLPSPEGGSDVTLTGIEVTEERSSLPFAIFVTVVAIASLGLVALLGRVLGRVRLRRADA